MSAASLVVEDPGFLTTVQDAGRPGFGHLGVPTSGPADAWSFAVANALVGNAPGAAAIEATVAGPVLVATADVLVAVAGADLGVMVGPGGRRLTPGHAAHLTAGESLRLGGPLEGAGVRAYVGVAGGIDVPVVLGSRSTCLIGLFGGFQGRPLRAGDRLVVGASTVGAAVPDRWPGDAIAPRLVGADGAVVLRILPGLDADATGRLLDRTWTVASASDRMGARLEPVEGSERHPPVAATGLVTTHGVVEGTVQVPPDGQPIVLLADHQPTGGYPVGGVVIRADLPSAGQLRAGDRLTFVMVTGPGAMEALREQRGAWEEAAAIHRADARWNDLWRSAGA